MLDGTLVLRDVIGAESKVEGVLVGVVDVDRETLVLERSRLISSFMRVLKAYHRCKGGGDVEELRRAWEEHAKTFREVLGELESGR